MATSKALTVAKELTQEELNALLQGAGYASTPGERQARIKLDGSIFKTSDTEEMYVYNPKHPEVPAFTARIVRPLDDYMAIWIDDTVARDFGRSDLAQTFSKKYFQPSDDRRLWPSDEVYEDIIRHGGLVDEKGRAVKPSWKGDLTLQIVPEDGNMTGQETEYVLTLPTTSVIEFRGSSREPAKGSISEFNFMQKLSAFAAANRPEGTDPRKAILNALTSYAMGGVVAEFRTGRGENKEANQSWTVIVADPVHIEPINEGDSLLGTGNDEDSV